MEINITRAELKDIMPFRIMFLQENNFQFICNKCHDYGWSDDYLIALNGVIAGYGCVWGTDKREDRDTIFEFYLLPPYRNFARMIFAELRIVSRAVLIESQSNDVLFSSMLYEFSNKVVAEAILFEDHLTTQFNVTGASFRPRKNEDNIEDTDSSHVVEWRGEIVATGGLMLNYNLPYADVYMGVKEQHRGKGLGSFIVQELKRIAYETGRVPVARCNVNNPVSKSTLQKAGFRVCGYRLKGEIRNRE